MRGTSAALALAFALLQGAPVGATEPTPIASLQPASNLVAYRANLLVQQGAYIVLTGGETLKAAANCACIAPRAGARVVVGLDPKTGEVAAMWPQTERDAALPSADTIPRTLLVMNPRSLRSDKLASEKTVRNVTVVIIADCPPQTPQNDDIYLSTDRSTFSPSETRMNRSDALHWTIALSIPEGSTVHYLFTRGSYSTVERDAANGAIPSHVVVGKEGAIVRATVARWADFN